MRRCLPSGPNTPKDGKEAAGIGCCAVRLRDEAVSRDALRRMRKAAFVFGCPPDTPERVCDAVRDTPGLDQDRFARDLHRRQAREVYPSDWEETRRSNDHVRQLQGDWPGMGSLNQIDGRDRYAFPTLLSRGPGGEFAVPNWRDLEDCIKALEPCPVPWPRPGRTLRSLAAIRRVRTQKPLRPRQPAAPSVKTCNWGKGLVHFLLQFYSSI